MSEEEKKAIEIIKDEIDRYKAIETPKEVYITDIKMLLNLIEKQQEKIESLENQLGFIEEQNKHINKLQKELYKQQKEVKELKEELKEQYKEEFEDRDRWE